MLTFLAPIFALGLAALTTAPAVEPSSVPACRFAGEPRDWTAQALDSWARLDRQRLHIANPIDPSIALFDQRCVYRLTPDRRGDFRAGGRRYRSSAAPHTGQIEVPGGSTAPAQRLAFATPTSDGMFFIMALPPLWRADTAESRDPRLLSMVVFMHEFTHTQQADGLGARIDRLLSLGLPQDANDDVIQDRFGERPGYREEWASETELFYEAAGSMNGPQMRTGLEEGLEKLRARQARWFTGEEALYAEADDVFLTLEGTGNWSAWAWLTDPRGGNLSREDAVAFVRGGSGHWSQDEGLGLMLAIDRLAPDWPAHAFGPGAMTVTQLAERALR